MPVQVQRRGDTGMTHDLLQHLRRVSRLGQTQEEAEDTMQKLIASEGVPYVDD